MIQHWETKLGDISLDKDSSANEYINNVEMYVRKLTKLGENWNDDKMVREFKAGVHDEDYGDIEVRVHSGTFAQLIEVVRAREQDLDHNATHCSKRHKLTRRARLGAYLDDTESNDDKSNRKRKAEKDPSGKHKSKPYVLFIPKFLFNSLEKDAKKNISKWRLMVNNAGTHMDYSEDMLVDTKQRDNSDSEPPPKKTEKGKHGRRSRGVTKTRRISIQNDSVEVKLASSDEDYIETSSDYKPGKLKVTFGDDSIIPLKPDHSINEKAAGSRVRALKCSNSIGISRG